MIRAPKKLKTPRLISVGFFDRNPKRWRTRTVSASISKAVSIPVHPTASVPVAPPENSSSAAVNLTPNYDHSSATVPGAGRGRGFRQTVCRHWLRGLCMKAEACGFLHQYDKARMPICRFFRLHANVESKIASINTPMQISKNAICMSCCLILLYAMNQIVFVS